MLPRSLRAKSKRGKDARSLDSFAYRGDRGRGRAPLCSRQGHGGHLLKEQYQAFPSLELDVPAPHVLRLTLRAESRLNAVSATVHRELGGIGPAIGADDETRAVIVRGAAGAFSAGGDLDLVTEIANDYETRLRVFHEARDLVYNIVNCPKPIVSAITGPAVGAGLAVGLLADVSI